MPELFQQLGQTERNRSRAAIVIVFVYPSQVQPDNVHMLEHNTFKSFQLPVNRENRKRITDVITQLYKDKLQLAKTRNTYERTDPGVLRFLNIFRCRQRLILIYFMCKREFKRFPNLANC